MSALSVSVNKSKTYSLEELQQLNKEELVHRILQLQQSNKQLKNIIRKNSEHEKSKESKKSKRPFDFDRVKKQHILLKLYYLGWDYQGFTTQENTSNTVEHYLFKALTKSCLVKDIQSANYHRCGRTDKGVSAFCQVISITVRCAEEGKPPLDYCHMLNRILPDNIKVFAWRPVINDFSARFNCTKRVYKYFFPRGNLKINVMQEAARYLLGTHDFRNLCKMDVGNGVVAFIRTIDLATVEVVNVNSYLKSNGYDMCVFTIHSQGFLWHQIRCIMGVLFLIGNGSESPQVIKELFDIKKNPQKPHYLLAHEVPLNLFNCSYDFAKSEGDWTVDIRTLLHLTKSLQHIWSLLAIKETMVASMIKDIQTNSPELQINEQASGLLCGVNSRVYVPILQRPRCDTLEKKIDHFVKRRRLTLKT